LLALILLFLLPDELDEPQSQKISYQIAFLSRNHFPPSPFFAKVVVMRLSINKDCDMLIIFHLFVIVWFVMIACLCLLANDLGVQGK